MVVYGIEAVPEFEDGEVHLAIGTFDGLHRGHRELIEQAVDAAKKAEGVSAGLTFWPHPSRILKPDAEVKTMMPPKVKIEHLEDMGVDLVIQVEFTSEFSKMEPDVFLKKLKKALPNLKAVYEGANFRFGHKHAGDVSFLAKMGKEMGFEVVKGEDVLYKDEIISSTRIREALLAGKIEEANAMLGYKYYSLGMAVEGSRKGEETGYHTLNFTWNPELRPKYGVYAVKVVDKHGKSEFAVANYGEREDMEPTLEVYLFDGS